MTEPAELPLPPSVARVLRTFRALGRDDNLSFFADLNARQSPTIAATLAILFFAVNGHPPQTTPRDSRRLRSADEGGDRTWPFAKWDSTRFSRA